MSVGEQTGDVFIVAELAQSYEGSFEEAQELVRAAARSGADAVKFQIFRADEVAVPDYKYFDLYRRLEFEPGQWAQLFELAGQSGLKVYADVFGLDTVAQLDTLGVDGWKIHAADMQNLSLIDAVGRTGRPVLLSCGGSTANVVAEALQLLCDSNSGPVCLLHGFQASPTAPADTSFRRLEALRRTFDLPVGYADHIEGDHPLAVAWPLVAVGAGASVIEKHLTLNRADQKEDYVSALDPGDFALMAQWIREAAAALGRADFDFSEAERQYQVDSRKQVVAARALAAGDTLSVGDLALKRATGAIKMHDLRLAVGRSLREPLAADSPVVEDSLSARGARPRVVAALACRAGGSRLYGKPVQMIGDRTILEYLVARLRSVPRLDDIVLAISEGVENELFVEYAAKLGLDYVVGDETDVLGRLILAAERSMAEHVLRSTTESPFVYTDNICELIERHITEGAALTVTEGLPDGSYCEIISLAALKDSHERGEDRHRSELCTLYIFEHPERYKHLKVQAPEKVRRASDIRLTVDYPEDLIVCRRIAEVLGREGPLFALEEIVDFLDADPQLNAVNNWIDSGHGRVWS